MIAKSILKKWFENLKKPTQEQFWGWMDSYWHKSEKLPSSIISNFDELLDSKVDKETGKGLSENDFTDEYKEKVDNMSDCDCNEILESINEASGKMNSCCDSVEQTKQYAYENKESLSEISTKIDGISQNGGGGGDNSCCEQNSEKLDNLTTIANENKESLSEISTKIDEINQNGGGGSSDNSCCEQNSEKLDNLTLVAGEHSNSLYQITTKIDEIALQDNSGLLTDIYTEITSVNQSVGSVGVDVINGNQTLHEVNEKIDALTQKIEGCCSGNGNEGGDNGGTGGGSPFTGFGLYYNMNAFRNPKFAPDGWRLPTKSEISMLRDDIEQSGGSFIMIKEGGYWTWNCGKVNPPPDLDRDYLNIKGIGFVSIKDRKIIKFLEKTGLPINYNETLASIVSAESVNFGYSFMQQNSIGKDYLFPVRLVCSDTNNAQCVDADGNTYETIVLGNRTWLKENYKCTKLNDGTPLKLYDYSHSNNTKPMYAYWNNCPESV